MAQLWTGSDQDFKDLFLRLKMREEFLPIGPLIQFGTDHRDFANIWDESAEYCPGTRRLCAVVPKYPGKSDSILSLFNIALARAMVKQSGATPELLEWMDRAGLKQKVQ